jgi:hypothetical protein
MAWSPPALERRSGSLQRTGDYATSRFHHLRDGTLIPGSILSVGIEPEILQRRRGALEECIAALGGRTIE